MLMVLWLWLTFGWVLRSGLRLCGKAGFITLGFSYQRHSLWKPETLYQSYNIKDSDISRRDAALWMETWGFVWNMEAKNGHNAERDFPHKSLYARRKKGKEVRGQRGGGVRVWRSLFLASEKSGVCGQWKRKGSVGILTWSSAVAFILHDPCESEGAARVGGGVHQNTNKWHGAYMVHTETQEEMQHKICWGEQWNSSDGMCRLWWSETALQIEEVN